jgi:hypothetical protein
VDKTTAKQPKVKQFEAAWFQDQQQRHLVTNTAVSAVKSEKSVGKKKNF